jgi:hypothetical protein
VLTSEPYTVSKGEKKEKKKRKKKRKKNETK